MENLPPLQRQNNTFVPSLIVFLLSLVLIFAAYFLLFRFIVLG
ncbi:MAG TPA: hypothetical protein VLE47_00420 [Candidatus Saccharimonadales bacterium]|nr:hypothetical protein [Candidatus Saccharimonadales bacterium]